LEKGPLFEDGKFLRNGIFSIYDEIYQDSVIEMIECSLITDNAAVFTGVGGDELSLIYENIATSTKDNSFNIEAYDFINDNSSILGSADTDLPNANISLSAIRSAQSRSPVFLRKNLWPINPLCCPDLVRFCQYLPRKIKAEKSIHRKVLENNGLSKEFTHPKIRENFNYIYEEWLRKKSKNNILNLINNSKLHEMGYIDKRKLLEHYLMYSALGKSKLPALFFYLFAALEYNLEFISRTKYNFEQQSAIFD
jgi:asparagine synthase (glutamine-hydrolysing)